ncbi:MAG: protein kinase [Solirubrobacteraceae bacterium]|nr:protein kinase [Solirubrobacteraceae bacterium]
MLQPGDTLAGYRIEAVAGVGGMGVVYRATQMSLDRPVALKVLSSTLVGNRTFRERFRREGRHAAALDHPNIIPVYEAGESNGLMFIAMRLVDGPSLADIIERGQLTGNAALGILRAIASALDAAHEAGLVHRDIKPQNMLLTPGGHPYLADFGITKGSDHGGLTHNGDFVGSLNYVAPEQIEGQDVGSASDIYSLAAVLFQALTGTYPFERDNDAALMHAHLTAEPPTMSARGIAAPATLDAVFARGMAKAPSDRFPTAAGLMDACAAALAGVTADQLERAPSFPPPAAGASPEVAAADPPASTQPDRFVWTPPAVPPPTPVSTPRPSGTPAPPAVGDRTTTDARRPGSPDPAPNPDDAQQTRSWRRPAMAAAAALLLVVAPILGYVLGRSDQPRASTSSSGAVSVSHDGDWASAAGDLEGLQLEQPVALRHADGEQLAAGRMPAFASGWDPLPQAVRDRVAGPIKPAQVRLAGRPAVRYAGALKSGGRLWVALLPDTRGWTAVACEGPTADRGDCAQVAATLRLNDGARPVTPGPDSAVAQPLGAAVTALSTARKTAEPALAAKSMAKRASAARRLSTAHRQAAASIKKVDGRPQEAALLTSAARALDDQAERLRRLAVAADRNNAAEYRVARAMALKQEQRIDVAIQRLSLAGYGEGGA